MHTHPGADTFIKTNKLKSPVNIMSYQYEIYHKGIETHICQLRKKSSLLNPDLDLVIHNNNHNNNTYEYQNNHNNEPSNNYKNNDRKPPIAQFPLNHPPPKTRHFNKTFQ